MEKDHNPDSMATIAMKPDYPPSEVYSTSEPPPAYRQPRSTAVQLARIAAFTVILSSMIIGAFILASTYVQARAGCQQLEQLDAMLEKELAMEAKLIRAEEEFSHSPLLPQALQQEPPASDSQKRENILRAPEAVTKNEEKLQSLDDNDHDDSNNGQSSESSENSSESESDSSGDSESGDDSSEEGERIPIRITLPLQLDFDELAGALIEKNQRSRMNCVVEKRRAEELVDHQARSVQLPFGLNLTTEPRLQKLTGERMAIFCESGDDQKMPENVEILRGFPVPLGGPVRLPLQFPVPPMAGYRPPMHGFRQPMGPMGAFRPPMPAQHMQAPAPQAPQDYQVQPEIPQTRSLPPFMVRNLPQFQPQQSQRILFHIKEQDPQDRQFPFQIREQMTPLQIAIQMREQEAQPQQQIIQIREEMQRPQGDYQIREQMEQQIPLQVREQIREHLREQIMRQQAQMREQEQPQQMQFQIREQAQPQQIPYQMREPQQLQFQIREQAQPQQMPYQMREQTPPQQMQYQMREQAQPQQMPYQMREQAPQQQEQMQLHRVPLQMALVPREVRIHVQRVPVPQVEQEQMPQDSHDSQEEQSQEEENMSLPISAEELQVVQQAVRVAEEEQEQEQREAAQQQSDEERADARNTELERQAMIRALPINLPVPKVDQGQEAPVQDPERPHYVQPRSVRSKRSIDSVLHREKRVKRCNCDCAC